VRTGPINPTLLVYESEFITVSIIDSDEKYRTGLSAHRVMQKAHVFLHPRIISRRNMFENSVFRVRMTEWAGTDKTGEIDLFGILSL
jgi:hypothetical protein